MFVVGVVELFCVFGLRLIVVIDVLLVCGVKFGIFDVEYVDVVVIDVDIL